MKGSLEWMELAYEAEFSSPLFDLPGRNTELLKSLHQSIHPRFLLRTRDLHVFGGTSLSDVCVRVTMFGGNGTIEVTAEKLSVSFNGLRGEQDTAICNECLILVEQALKKALPEAEITTFTARSTLSLRLGDGSVVARDFLRQVVRPGIDMELNGLGSAALYPCINLEIRNEDEGWKAVLHAYDNAVEKSSIIASCSIACTDSPELHLHEQCIGHQRRLLDALLQGLDIAWKSDPANMVMS